LGGLGGDCGDIFLVLDCIQVYQGLEGEVSRSDIEISLDEILDFLPVVLFQVFVPESHHYGACPFEGIYQFSQFDLDRVLFEILLQSEADLEVLVRLSFDLLRIDVVKLSLSPSLREFLPFLQGPPHQASESEGLP